MLKVAIVQVVPAAFAYQWSLPPLGIGWLIAEAKRCLSGVEIAFFRELDPAIEWKPAVVGVASDSGCIVWAMEAAERLRRETDAFIVLGGPHVTALPLRLPAPFHAGIVGEGELTFVEMLQMIQGLGGRKPAPADLMKVRGMVWHEDSGTVMSPPRPLIEDLDQLPLPDRDALGDYAVPRWLRVHTIVSRGCPYNCSFCSSSALWPGLRQNSPEYVVNEIETLRHEYDPIEIYLFDDLLVANRKRLKKIFSLMRERGLDKDIVFRAHGRANLMDRELCDLLAEHGVRYLDFGIESNSERVLRYMNKTAVTPEVNQRAMDMVKGSDLSAGASLIIGSPCETNEDVQSTMDFVVRNKGVIERVSCGMLVPLPGTKVWRDAEERGLVSETMDWSRISFYTPPEKYAEQYAKFPVMAQEMSREDLFAWFMKFNEFSEQFNVLGESRYWEMVARRLHERETSKRDELARLKGSRVMRGAMALRGLFGKGEGYF